MIALVQLDQLADQIEALKEVPRLAAAAALDEVMEVARAEWSAGEAPDETPWEPLHGGAGTPLTSRTSQITGATRGAGFVITTPEVLKYHQGGYPVHTGAAGDRLREAKKAAVEAKANADAEGLKSARANIRHWKKTIRTQATRVAARRMLPGRRAMPIPWGQAIQRAVTAQAMRMLQGAG